VSNAPALSVVTTLYRSAGHLRAFHERVRDAAAALGGGSWEMVLVNDGSPDDSLAVAVALHGEDARVRVVDLSRNFGHHKAMMTGLEHARGERVFLIDCDLEEDPALLARFDEEMRRTGADVVYGVQSRRKGGPFERWSGEIFFRAFNAMATYPIPANLITMRLMTRRYVRSLLEHREREMVISGLWALTGYAQVALPVEKSSRGTSSYDLRRKIVHFVNAVTSFSDRPLTLIFWMGLGISTFSALAAAYLVIRRVFFGVMLDGWPSLMVSVWLLGGLTLFSIGVIGIYLSKVFLETKQRPYTIVRALYERQP
jgi:putative glycosyltransferase